MSRAFVKEQDDTPEVVMDLPVSSAPNLVTPRGLAMMDDKIRALEKQLAALSDEDDPRRQMLKRDLRYWKLRHATARVTHPAEAQSHAVAFGSRVKIQRGEGQPETLEIVGEDEADPAHGRISWVSPIAKALMGKEPDDSTHIMAGGNRVEVDVLAVENG